MVNSIERHCRELNRCNQRGGRMLSVFDLIDAGTMDMELAAYLAARISGGASFMVGAGPGGVGKTTVMCALLNFVPADVSLAPATDEAVQQAIKNGAGKRRCYICHEIGAGYYYAYLWGRALRDYCGLSQQGHILATNLHADDIEQTRYQICVENEVPRDRFNRFELLIYLQVLGNWLDPKRAVSTVFAGDGVGDHVQIYSMQSGLRTGADGAGRVDAQEIMRWREFLEKAYTSGVRTVEQTRMAVVEFLDATSARSK